MTLHKSLAEVQQKLNAPKGQTNTFGGYRYRSCEDILQAVKPLLGDLSIVISDEIIMIGDRVYVKATASFTDGKECIQTTAYAREELTKKGMDASQITGSASSYARKYALNGLLLIDDSKDADATNDHGRGEGSAPARQEQTTSQSEPSTEADAMIIAQLNAATTVPDLVKVMNSLSNDQQRLVRNNFTQRMNELKKAA